jgi:sugar (pentulose or hexulose) kinase
MQELCRTRAHGDIAAISVSSMLGWVAVDRDGSPVEQAWTWMHQQTDQYMRLNQVPLDSFHSISGRRFSPELGALKWIALRAENPESYRRVHRFVSLKDYVNFKLTGNLGMDYTHAGYTGLFNVRTKEWDPVLLRYFDMDWEKLPSLYSASDIAGTLDPTVARMLGVRPDIPVVAGGPDGSLAALGGGGVRSGITVDVIGTTDVVFTTSDRFVLDESCSLVHNVHPLPGLYLYGGPLGMTGGTAAWFVNLFLAADASGETRDRYALLERQAGQIPEGSEGAKCIASLSGERTPTWNPAIRGTFVGLRPEHGSAHLYRAILEANAYALRSVTDRINRLYGSAGPIVCLGGGANNRLGLQIRANVLGCAVGVSPVVEASTYGAAILAGCATGHHGLPDWQDAMGSMEIIHPIPESHRKYERLYQEHLRLLEAMSSYYNSYD